MSDAIGLYLRRDSGLHRLHPLTNLSLFGFWALVALLAPGLWGGYLVLALALFPLAAWGRVLGPLIQRTWRLALPFAVSVFLVQGLFWPGGTPVLGLGPLAFREEGVRFAVRSTGRILALIASFMLLGLSTRPDSLMIAMSQRGMPPSITYIVLSALQLIPYLQERASTILDAQRARGLDTEGGMVKRIRALVPTVTPLVLGSLLEVEQRAIALEARGFRREGPKTFLRQLDDTRPQAALRVGLIAGAVLVTVGRLVWELRT